MSTAMSFTAGTPTSSSMDTTLHSDEYGHVVHRRHTDEQFDGHDDPHR
jgi:hypothetical protein